MYGGWARFRQAAPAAHLKYKLNGREDFISQKSSNSCLSEIEKESRFFMADKLDYKK